ncbi:hypothetical protein KIH74_17065 [Kineosporia sp. J2-2]|uniref:DUF218 domain-containing protein n=1 Tax=Kineosporia corallincola TaxID=2835133 RepID=A0ABS5THV8_9ACTN|nr:hypothetical protein [Kineosporia corallincola]MBT0770657.1 hypothetical protein [Kineosporia corallincola]
MTQRPRGAVTTVLPFFRNRWTRGLAVALVVLVAAAGTTGARLYSFPRTDTLDDDSRVDAVLALGGRPETALYAQGLAERGITPVVLISNPYPREPAFHQVHDLCASKPTGYRLICFDPSPRTTRGEARELGRLAAENGWDEVAVVAARYHISRARTITARCFPGTLYLVEAPLHIPAVNWSYQYVRQTLGYVKVAFQQGC